MLSVVTVIFVWPSESGVTRPLASTVATFGLLLFHVSALMAVAGSSTAFSCTGCATAAVPLAPSAMPTAPGSLGLMTVRLNTAFFFGFFAHLRVIFVLPLDCGDTRPLASTVATFGLLLDQIRSL